MTILTRDVLHDDDPELLEAIDRVTRLIADECSGDCCELAPSLEMCVHEVVTSRWRASRIKTYVPLLALGEVRMCIRTGTCGPRVESPLR